MLTWAVIAHIAGVLGFIGIAVAASAVAKVLLGILLAIAVILFVLAPLAGAAITWPVLPSPAKARADPHAAGTPSAVTT
ncbi:MAG: DUF1328 domain-containing protein [Acetobacteraceae bacterium]|nr:DUF1328 domain-containing protein [Acetobacteraceae bacterium]